MLSSWRMYEMHLALFLKAGCDSCDRAVAKPDHATHAGVQRPERSALTGHVVRRARVHHPPGVGHPPCRQAV
jgi:hypothetical protein